MDGPSQRGHRRWRVNGLVQGLGGQHSGPRLQLIRGAVSARHRRMCSTAHRPGEKSSQANRPPSDRRLRLEKFNPAGPEVETGHGPGEPALRVRFEAPQLRSSTLADLDLTGSRRPSRPQEHQRRRRRSRCACAWRSARVSVPACRIVGTVAEVAWISASAVLDVGSSAQLERCLLKHRLPGRMAEWAGTLRLTTCS